MYTVVCALHTRAVFFSLHFTYVFCHAFIPYIDVIIFFLGLGGAKPVMRHVLPLSIPLQAVAAAIWIIKEWLLH